MSNYQSKILSGQKPEPADWTAFLKAAHRIAPGMTPKAFAKPVTANGFNSYQILVNSVREHQVTRVLDLACGDGHLVQYLREAFGPEVKIVGVDMSDAEIAVARASIKDDRLSLKCEPASAISESSQNFDLVLCHMALMLMNPLGPILQEVIRLLKPGGIFAGVVGGEAVNGGFLATYNQLIADFMKKKFPEYKNFPAAGDARTGSLAGLKELFANDAFTTLSVTDFAITVRLLPEDLWSFFGDMYRVSILPELAREELKNEIILAGKAHVSGDASEVTFELPMRLFKATRG